jgi:uncharacterized protein DUF4443
MFYCIRKIQLYSFTQKLCVAIKTGIEQRDVAIKMGALGATTLIYKDNKITMPGEYNNNNNFIQKEPHVTNLLIDKLKPQDRTLWSLLFLD